MIPNLQRRFENTESEWVKHKMHSYMSEQPCDVCYGTRLEKEAMCVRLHRAKLGDMLARAGTAIKRCAGGKLRRSKARYEEGDKGEDDSGSDHASMLPGYSIDDVARMTVEKAKSFLKR